jgi:DNA invertase Pin-like site-specific DNA recombinase
MIRAAQYLRKSKEHQRYSLHNQNAAIARYACAHDFHVVRTYADPGRTGLTLKHRLGLQGLLADILQPDRDFDAVLVLDVSRWGRFQDLDEAAHYEFLCRQAGVSVIYCGEAFPSDGSVESALFKELKRLMAAEYSRELSAKIAAAKLLRAERGHCQGAPLIYGIERVLVDARGRERCRLERGQTKAQGSDHVVLQPGPPEELQVLRRIFRRFVYDQRNASAIAAELNAEGVPFIGARRWSGDAVFRLLRSELMVGVYVYNRTSSLLAGRLTLNPSDDWVRVKLFEPIISPKLFARAQARMPAPLWSRRSRGEMLAGLRELLRKHGRLSAELIDQSRETPCVNTYYHHFRSLGAAYAAIGYTPPRGLPQRRN